MKAISLKQPWANMVASGEKSIETRRWRTSYRGPLLIVSSLRPKIEPAGMALALVELVGCRPMTRDDGPGACCEVYPGAWAWLLENIRKLERPFPVKGQLGLYEVNVPLDVTLLEMSTPEQRRLPRFQEDGI